MGKMMRNVTKSQEQRRALEDFFLRRQTGWERDEIERISRAEGLTRQQVYKWLWDRKRAERQKVKLESSEDSYNAPQFDYVAIYFKKYKIHVPANKQQAAVFYVRPSVSVWAIMVLKSQGWQLVRDNPSYSPGIGRLFPLYEMEQEQHLKQDEPILSMIGQNRLNRYFHIREMEKKEEIYESQS